MREPKITVLGREGEFLRHTVKCDCHGNVSLQVEERKDNEWHVLDASAWDFPSSTVRELLHFLAGKTLIVRSCVECPWHFVESDDKGCNHPDLLGLRHRPPGPVDIDHNCPAPPSILITWEYKNKESNQ